MKTFPDERLGETCGDGGVCHHGCTDRCFRREGCAPLTDSGISLEEWRYDDYPASLQVSSAFPEPYGYAKPDAAWVIEPRFIRASGSIEAWQKEVFTVPLWDQPPVVPVRPLELLDPTDDEAFEWVTKNVSAIRRDDGSLHYNLAAVVRAYQAGKAAQLPEQTRSSMVKAAVTAPESQPRIEQGGPEGDGPLW